MSTFEGVKVSRRTTLRWFAAAAATASGVGYYALRGREGPAPPQAAAQPVSKGYGTDPDLLNPSVPWTRTMTVQQLQMAAVLADLILPGTESAPAPSALGIQDFVDEWVSAPYPEQQADRKIIFDGFSWIDAEAHRRWQRHFMQLEVPQQGEIVAAMVPKNIKIITTAPERFFQRFRFVVVGAYYTTPEGLKDIGYIGNVPLASYPPVTEKERAILEAELQQLGI